MEEEENLGMDLFDLNLEDLDFLETEEKDIDPKPEQDQEEDSPDSSEEDKDINPDEDKSSEEVVEDKETEEEDDPDSNEDAATTSPDLYKSLVTVLTEEGVLTEVDDEKEIKSINDVIDLVKGEISRQEFSDLNDLQKEAVEAYRAGIPVEKFNRQKEVEFQLEGINEDVISQDENLRKQLIYQQFKLKGFSDEKAARFTKRSFDADEDVEDAKDALQALKVNVKEKFDKEREDLVKQKEAAIKAEKDQQKRIKDKVFKTDEVIKGYKINEGLKKKIFSEMYNPTHTNPDTGKKENSLIKYQRENTEDFMHKLYYLWTVTKGFEDFQYFQNKERSKGVKDLENALRQSSHVRGGGDPSFLDDKDSFDFEIGDELILD